MAWAGGSRSVTARPFRFITAKNKLAAYNETITDAVKFRVDYLERVRRSGVTVAQRAEELIETKRPDGMSQDYISDLKYIGVLFSYAVKRRILDFNSVSHTAKPKLIDKSPEILTIDELQTLLNATNRVHSDVLPWIRGLVELVAANSVVAMRESRRAAARGDR